MSIRTDHSPMISAACTPPRTCENGFQDAPVSLPRRYEEGLQSYNTSGPELDLSKQPPPKLAYSQDSSGGPQREKTPSEAKKRRSRGLRRSTVIFSVALIIAIIIVAVLSGTVSGLSRTEKAESSLDSKSASAISNGKVVSSSTTASSQARPSNTNIPSSSFCLSSSSSSSSIKSTPIITSRPNETYSIISSPTLTISRDCPGSNGTTVVINDVRPQSFIKNCGWVYHSSEPNVFTTTTVTLDACISYCATYNVMNGTGPLQNCIGVEWRTDLTQELAGYCFGNFDTEAGRGEPAVGGEENVPADAAFFLGWY